jgi:lysophospholipase L1-like esterase
LCHNPYMKRLLIGIALATILVIGVTAIMFSRKSAKVAEATGIRYAAIGDSYTIGEGARRNEAWPEVLARDVTAAGKPMTVVANPSVTGWTTQQVVDAELSIYDESKPTFATLQIGVNDWVQGVSAETFHRNLMLILDHMQAGLPDKSQLVLVTIPDFGATPTGPQYANGRDISTGLASFNDIIKAEGAKRGLPVADVFAISQRDAGDSSLIAADGLHPSAKQYAIWEREAIFPLVKPLLHLL